MISINRIHSHLLGRLFFGKGGTALSLAGIFLLAIGSPGSESSIFEDDEPPPRDPVSGEHLFEPEPVVPDRILVDEDLIDRDAVVLVAWNFYEQGDYSRAVFWFRRALGDSEEYGEGAFGLALSLLGLGEEEEALLLARDWIDREPRMGDVMGGALVRKASKAFEDGKHDEVVDLMEEASQYRSISREERLMLGWSLFFEDRLEQARSLFEDLYEAEQTEAHAEGLATVLMAKGEDAALVDLIGEADSEFREKFSPLLGDLYVNRALASFEAEDPTEASRWFREAAEFRELSFEERKVRGWSELNAGNTDSAWAIFEETYREAHGSESLDGLVNTTLASGEAERYLLLAEELEGGLFERAEEIRGPLLRRRGMERYEEADFEEAARLLSQANAYEPLEPGEEMVLGWSHYRSGQVNRASEIFRRHLHRGPPERRDESAYGLALSLIVMGEVGEAERLAEARIDDDPRMGPIIADIRVRQGASALDEGLYNRSVRLLEEAAEYRFLSPDEQSMLGWSYYHSGRVERAADVFEELYRDSPNEENAAGLFSALFASEDFARMEKISSEEAGPLRDLSDPVVGDYYVNRAVERFRQEEYAWSVDDFRRAATFRELTPSEQSALAWSRFHLGDGEGAVEIFEELYRRDPDPEVAEDLAVVALELGQSERLERIAGELGGPIRDELAPLRQRELLREGGRRFDAGDYRASIEAYEEAASMDPLTPDQRMGLAWAYYQIQDDVKAADLFEELYREEPNRASAEGLFLSASALDDYSRLNRVRRQVDGPLDDLLDERDAVVLHGKGIHLKAYQLAPESFPELKNVDGGDVALAGSLRQKSGQRGLYRLRIAELPILTGRYYFNSLHEVGARVSGVTLDAKDLQPAPVSLVGSIPGAGQDLRFRFPPTTRVDWTEEAEVWYQYHNIISPYFKLRRPASDHFSPRLSGRAGVVVNHDDGWIRGSFFSLPVEESILSYTGIIDPYTGEPWGRVSDTGLELALLQFFPNPDYSAYGNVRAGILEGIRVDRNEHLRAGGALGRDIHLDGFHFLSVGPAFQYDMYRDNRNFFTFGHGGYFSPEYLVQLLAQFDFLTLRGKNWMLRSNGGWGYQWHRNAAAPFFPRNPDGRMHPGTVGSNYIYQIWVEGGYLLSPRWMLGSTVHYRKTPIFDYGGANLFLRFFFGKRASLLESDLGIHRAKLFESHLGVR